MYKIYEIRCNETDEVYIGKTIRTLDYRLRLHRFEYNLCTSKQIILRGDYVMCQIDECDTEEDSIFLESYYIRNTNKCINIVVPGRTREEYYEVNKDRILSREKEYREAHKDEIKEKKKEYREAHKDEIKEKKKEYYKAHKDEIKEKKKQKYTCECGTTLRKDGKSSHERTQTHINFINSK